MMCQPSVVACVRLSIKSAHGDMLRYDTARQRHAPQQGRDLVQVSAGHRSALPCNPPRHIMVLSCVPSSRVIAWYRSMILGLGKDLRRARKSSDALCSLHLAGQISMLEISRPRSPKARLLWVSRLRLLSECLMNQISLESGPPDPGSSEHQWGPPPCRFGPEAACVQEGAPVNSPSRDLGRRFQTLAGPAGRPFMPLSPSVGHCPSPYEVPVFCHGAHLLCPCSVACPSCSGVLPALRGPGEMDLHMYLRVAAKLSFFFASGC